MKTISSTNDSAFSLVEVVIVVAIIGIMAALGVVGYGNITSASKQSIAQNLVETLNNATKEFAHAQYPILSEGENSDSSDELLILQTLQWKDPGIELGVAGPFMKTDWIPSASASSEEYRAVWTGRFWKVAAPGENGTGLKIDFQAADVGVNYVHPNDFTPFAPYTDSGSNLDVSTDPEVIDSVIDNVIF